MVPTARPSRPLLIAGGGIGGLAVALALAKVGYKCRVLERQSAFDQAGAGIQIGPNGVAALRALGVADGLAPHVGRPDEIAIHEAVRGRLLTALPLGETIAQRLGAPYWTAHRADLHSALLASADREPAIVIQMGFEVSRLEATADGVRLISTQGSIATGSALIGTDGLWSKVRSYVAERVDLRFAGWRAYRTVAPTAAIPASLQANATGLWLAPRAHIVHYPVRGTTDTAVVVIAPAKGSSDGWGHQVDREALLQSVRNLAPDLQGLLAAGQHWKAWDLFDVRPLNRWSNGRVTLLGDAAHPVLPYLAQGGVLALEDAITLATAMSRQPDSVPEAFAAYAKQRMRRTARVRTAARRNGDIYHLGGTSAFARNLVLRTVPAPRLIGQYDWLYGWTPDANGPFS